MYVLNIVASRYDDETCLALKRFYMLSRRRDGRGLQYHVSHSQFYHIYAFQLERELTEDDVAELSRL